MCNDGPFDQGFDIAKCLEDERLIGLSQFEQRLKVSEEDDENLKEREERAFKLKYQDEIKRFNKHADRLEENFKNTYSVIKKNNIAVRQWRTGLKNIQTLHAK
jgi:uncharacterized membrane protein YukC